MQEITCNNILDVNTNIINNYKKLFDKENILNESHNNKLKDICEMTLSNSGKHYDSNFQMQLNIVFKELYDSQILEKYIFDVSIIDAQNSKNNEFILLNKLFCFYFVIKIMSNEINGKYNNILEKNISIFINNNITFNNTCPHFILYITEIENINNEFYLELKDHNQDGVVREKIRFKTRSNIGLIYHNISPWYVTNFNKSYKITNLKSLLEYFCTNIHSLNYNHVVSILYNILFQIVYSICTLSKYNINHNDLRTENILLQNGYDYKSNDVDQYTITINHIKSNKDKETINFYVPNYGFKIKIIDFGLSSSDTINNLQNPCSELFELTDDAGIYNIFSEIYDLHCIINEIYIELYGIFKHSYICDFMEQIVKKKYIGINKNNKYINEYWRLGFPFTIKNFIEKSNDPLLNSIQLNYNQNNILVVDNELKNNLIQYICDKSGLNKSEIPKSIMNNIIDPLDNNERMILKPIEAIKLFNKYDEHNNQNKSFNIIDSYHLNL